MIRKIKYENVNDLSNKHHVRKGFNLFVRPLIRPSSEFSRLNFCVSASVNMCNILYYRIPLWTSAFEIVIMTVKKKTPS